MATQEALPLSLKYSERVLLKTLLESADGGLKFVGRRVVVGGWVKSAKEVKKPSPHHPPPALTDDDNVRFDREKRGGSKDVSCVEILQSRIPLIRSILEVFGGGAHAPPRKKIEAGPPKPTPPQLSTAYLLVTDGSCVASLQVLFFTLLSSGTKAHFRRAFYNYQRGFSP